jgi:hypothetical protein
MDAGYLDRLVEAFTELLRRERRTDLDFAEITRRIRTRLGREVPSQTVGRWMKGKVQPRDPAERKAFAEVLGASVGWLFYNEQPGHPEVYSYTPEERAADAIQAEHDRAARTGRRPRPKAGGER